MNVKRFANVDNNILQLLAVTALVFATMSILEPGKFLRYYNFESIFYTFPELGILSIAMMISMLTGGIDLSVVGVANLSGILAGVFFVNLTKGQTLSPEAMLLYVLAGILLALSVGIMAGAINGFLITKLRITPILATMGTAQLFTGICLVISGGPAIVGFPAYWAFIGNGKVLGVAFPLVIFVFVAAGVAFLLGRTLIGVNLMLIGANPKAAVFAGIRTARMVFVSYLLTGVLASIAGIILSGRANAAKSDYGASYLLQAVLISVLGGTNPAGGFGSVLGVTIAVIALMLLSSGFQIMRFSNHLIDFIWGAFLLLIMVVNYYNNTKRQNQ
jgi:simple sugar transport system permease protein